MSQRKKLVAGNWKMNGLSASLAEMDAIGRGAEGVSPGVDLIVCPPATLIERARLTLAGSRVALGGQDCHWQESGAFTGDISAQMWADAGARYVIVGHSERRSGHGESDELVAAKAAAVIEAGLSPIICVGETLAERDAGRALEVVIGQLRASVPHATAAGGLVIAYEPVWAIGTGKVPSADDVASVHAEIRQGLVALFGPPGASIPILYGGSVKPDNAAALLSIPDVDGALVGGASLRAAEFLAIAAAAA
jgi:triosephosphate isomerase